MTENNEALCGLRAVRVLLHKLCNAFVVVQQNVTNVYVYA